MQFLLKPIYFSIREINHLQPLLLARQIASTEGYCSHCRQVQTHDFPQQMYPRMLKYLNKNNNDTNN